MTPRLIDFTSRLFMLSLSLTIGAMVLFTGIRLAHAAEIKTLSVVNSDTLKAGDIFSGLSPDQADYVLGTPPQPGKDLVIDARTLGRIATTIDLNWQPKSLAEQVVVRRAATIVTEDQIRAAVNSSLRAYGVDGKFNLVFATAEAPQIIMTPDQAPTVAVKTLHFDPQKDVFEIVLAAPSVEHPSVQITLPGRIQRLVSVPVLRNTMRHGDIIGNTDIDMIDIPSDDVQNGMLLKAENLSGLTPERVLYAGKPVRDSEVQRPQVLARGDFITLIYANGPMMLTTKGKAMQNAAKGDMVSVVNISSSRALQGIASGDHEVTVAE